MSEHTSEYVVTGMTCEHCVASVTEEISELPGVTGVEVELAGGHVRVTSDRDLPRDEVDTAVREAGYSLA